MLQLAAHLHCTLSLDRTANASPNSCTKYRATMETIYSFDYFGHAILENVYGCKGCCQPGGRDSSLHWYPYMLWERELIVLTYLGTDHRWGLWCQWRGRWEVGELPKVQVIENPLCQQCPVIIQIQRLVLLFFDFAHGWLPQQSECKYDTLWWASLMWLMADAHTVSIS